MTLRALTIWATFVVGSARLASPQVPDSLPSSWQRLGTAESADFYVIRTSKVAPHGGQTCLEIDSQGDPANGFGAVVQRFPADSFRGNRVRLSGYARTTRVERRAGLWMRIDNQTDAVGYDDMTDRPLVGTTDWQRQELVLDVPQSATRINIGAVLAGAGTICIDDLEFGVVDRTVATTGITIGPFVHNPLPPDAPRAPRNLGVEP